MRKTLLIALLGLTGISAVAENKVYTYTDAEGFPVLGYVRRISPNGKWAVGGDDTYQTGGFIIDTANPAELSFFEDGQLLDVADSGVAAGIYYEKINYATYEHAGVCRNGEWTKLPEPEALIGRSAAVAISDDGSMIAGHGLCRPIPDEPGRYFPIIWTLDEATGEYQLTRIYDNLVLDGTYGFFTYDMTPDGSKIIGTQSLDFGDLIGLILDVATGELTRFHNIEIKPWQFEGIEGWYDTMFVDGYIDGLDLDNYFAEIFFSANNQYIYGSVAEVTDVQSDGMATVTNQAAIYDISTGTFTTGSDAYIYTSGLGTEYLFTSGGTIVVNGTYEMSVQEYFDLDKPVDIVYDVAANGTAIGGSGMTWIAESPAETPVLVLLDDDSTLGVERVAVDAVDAAVKVVGNTIVAEGARIYTASGTLVSASGSARVTPGVYVVVANGKSLKVVVK